MTNARRGWTWIAVAAGALLVVAMVVVGARDAREDDRTERYGDAVALEGRREALAFFAATAAHGDPPGWQEWVQQHPAGETRDDVFQRRFQPYFAEARLSSAESAAGRFAWELVAELRRDLNAESASTDATVDDFHAWMLDEDAVWELAPSDVLPRYRDQLDGKDSGAEHAEVVDDLVRRAEALGAPTPEPSSTHGPDDPPSAVSADED